MQQLGKRRSWHDLEVLDDSSMSVANSLLSVEIEKVRETRARKFYPAPSVTSAFISFESSCTFVDGWRRKEYVHRYLTESLDTVGLARGKIVNGAISARVLSKHRARWSVRSWCTVFFVLQSAWNR